MKPECCYFVAGGRTLEAIQAYHVAAKAHLDYMQALGNEIGQPNLWQQDGRVVGFSGAVGSTIPVGLRRSGNKGMLVPNRRTAEGRALLKRMQTAPTAPTRATVMYAAGLGNTIYLSKDGRYYIPTCGWETIGDTVVFLLPAGEKGEPRHGVPYDCERILTSRYWLMKEANASTESVK